MLVPGYSSVISMDADGQHDPEEIRFLTEHEKNPDCIIVGSRMKRRKRFEGEYNSMISPLLRFARRQSVHRRHQCGYGITARIVKGLKLVTE
jgi:hypothetical protein